MIEVCSGCCGSSDSSWRLNKWKLDPDHMGFNPSFATVGCVALDKLLDLFGLHFTHKTRISKMG